MSEPQPDGSVHALTLIAFIGSVFSPYYAWARRRRGDDGAPAESHCAVNLSLYHRPAGARSFQRLWAMTERGSAQLQRSARQLQIGPSRLAWQVDGSLRVDIDEWTAPWPRRLRGRLEVQPGPLPAQAFALDAAGLHLWQPISPSARVEVQFDAPRLHWQGQAYLDANHGSRPLERDFDGWQWSRSALPGLRSRILYEAQARDVRRQALALDLGADGRLHPLPLPPRQPLASTGWGLARHCRSERAPQLLATLESGPFYARSLLCDPVDGGITVHESLSLRRFSQPWVQAMLPFRMPRWAGAR